MTEELLTRIAAALDRIAPPPAPAPDLSASPAFRWDGTRLAPADPFSPVDYDLLSGIDAQKQALLDNLARHADGHAAHDALLWGARGTGKSASVAACVGKLQRQGKDIALVQCAADRLESLPILFDLLRMTKRPFVIFIDDLGFDHGVHDARVLRSLLEGGVVARPGNVRLAVTSNRRHIVSRSLTEQDDPINPRDVVDDNMALSDRFGISLGFHAVSQDAYVAIVAGYAAQMGLDFDAKDAIQWATQRGSRSGRVAWQYVTEIAGRAGKAV